jgi:hypothetical protein
VALSSVPRKLCSREKYSIAEEGFTTKSLKRKEESPTSSIFVTPLACKLLSEQGAEKPFGTCGKNTAAATVLIEFAL